MADWLLQSGSYLGIFVFMVLTGCGLPLPEEVAIVFAGVRSAHGDMFTPFAYAACLLGALVGDAAMYHIGRRFGHSLIRRKPKLAKLLHADREELFENAIQRHGLKVLLIARFMIGVRGPVYLAAGVVRIPFKRFLIWDLVCATTVVSIFFGLSYYLVVFSGDKISQMFRDTEVILTVAGLTVGGTIAFFMLRRHRRKLLEQVLTTSDAEASAEEKSPPADTREAS